MLAYVVPTTAPKRTQSVPFCCLVDSLVYQVLDQSGGDRPGELVGDDSVSGHHVSLCKLVSDVLHSSRCFQRSIK